MSKLQRCEGICCSSSNLPLIRASIDIGQINEAIKVLSSKNNFVFTDHQNTIINDSWVDCISLENSDKAILASGFAEKDNKFLCQGSIFQRIFTQ